ncbi:MAG TPA: hypothetical protein VNH11_16360 [Pirellulales bacterium]|nr:hypothetical protein [Pirellulales bacterium]
MWIIISDPDKDAENVLIVNVTSWRADKDQTCLVGPGDHPLIEHNSCINFHGSRVYPDQHLNWLFNGDKIVLHEPLSPAVLQRVREGAVLSPRMKLAHGQILLAQGLVES